MDSFMIPGENILCVCVCVLDVDVVGNVTVNGGYIYVRRKCYPQEQCIVTLNE